MAKCVRSLFGQSLQQMEFVFVDDCSPDQSIMIMQNILSDEFPHRKSQVKVIRHTKNSGVASARQHGVEAATGEYLIHCDPDDWTELDMYATLSTEALRCDADIVICDFISESIHGSERSVERPHSIQQKDLISDICGITRTPIYGALWNKLIRRSLLNNIRFVEGCNYMEDVVYFFTLLQKPGLKFSYCHFAPYHYRLTNRNSLTITGASRKQILADLVMIDHIHSFAEEADSHIAQCIEGLTVSIILRAFTAGVLNNEEFKRFYGKYRTYHRILPPKLALQLPLLRLAMRGHYRIVYRLYSLARAIYRSICQHGNGAKH